MPGIDQCIDQISGGQIGSELAGEIDTMLAWRAGGRLLIGRERIALLESVMEHKSITKAAEVMGLATKRLGMPSTRSITCCRAQRLSHAPAARMAAAPK